MRIEEKHEGLGRNCMKGSKRKGKRGNKKENRTKVKNEGCGSLNRTSH